MKRTASRCGHNPVGEGLRGRVFRFWDCNRSEEWRPACGQIRSYEARRIWGAADKAANLGGESPLPSIARFRRLAYPEYGKRLTVRCSDVKVTAALW